MPRSEAEARALGDDPRLLETLNRSIDGVAKARGLVLGGYDAEMSDDELDLVSGGPTVVEYSVMLALVIVVCIFPIASYAPSTTSWSPVSPIGSQRSYATTGATSTYIDPNGVMTTCG